MQNAADANDLIQLVSLCRDRLRSDGMGFEVISDLDEYERAMSEIGKEENYPMASTSMHDMTTEDAMGVLIRRGDDLIGGVASRLMHLGGDGLARHLQKSARRYYGGNRREMVHGVCSGADDVRGRAVYEGELFLAEGWRGRAVNLPAVMHFVHAISALTWSPDWIYAFIRHHHASKAAQYGFSGFYVAAQHWTHLGERRNHDECLLTLRPRDLVEAARFYTSHPASFAAIREKSSSGQT